MEQVIGEREARREITRGIESEYGITVLRGEDARATRKLWEEVFPETSGEFLDYYYEQRIGDNTVFAVRGDELQAMLQLAPYSAALHRNSPRQGTKRLPSMVDIIRTDTNLVSVAATREAYRQKGCMGRLMSGALEYQRRMKVPFCFVVTGNEEFFGHFGFHYIYDRPQYELNLETISEEMLRRAADGETVALVSRGMPDAPERTLCAASPDSLLLLAHFVNARLCRQYRLFVIRSAVYYERFQRELRSNGGELFLIMEKEQIIGYFAYANEPECMIREAVFEQEPDIAQYLCIREQKRPAVMARITNLPEMLKHISGDGKVTIAIRITDPVLAENNGLFIWYLDERGSYMERVSQAGDGEDPSMRPEVTATIGEFTAFIFEYITLKQNAKFGSIYLSGPAWINERY